MNKVEFLELLNSLNISKDKYYLLSGGSMLLHGLRTCTDDLDLCVSDDILYDFIKKYNLKEEDKTKDNTYKLPNNIELSSMSTYNLNIVYVDGYPVEDLKDVLAFKESRNAPKDQDDIKIIKDYLLYKEHQ